MQPAWLATLAAAALMAWSPTTPLAGGRFTGARLPGAAPSGRRAAGPDTLVGRLQRPEVLSVTIRGAHGISAAEIRQSIVTTASHCRGIALEPFCWVSKAPYFYQRFYLDRDELKRDVIRIRLLYWLRGYRLASVDTAVTPPVGTTARITFTVHEGPATRIASLTVIPDTLFSPHVLDRLLRLRRGAPLDLNKLDTSALRIRHRLWTEGYADALVDTTVALSGQPPDDSAMRAAARAGLIHAGTAAVGIRIAPRARAFVDTVVVTGNRSVSAQTIRHTMLLRPKSLFLRGDVERSQRALYQTNLFRSASIRVDSAPGKPDSLKEVLVNVVEGPPREATVGAGFTTADFLSFSTRLNDYNWVGGGRQLVLTGGLGNLFAHGLYSAFNNGYKEIPPDISPQPFLSPTWSLGATVTQPWFLAPENALALGVEAHRRIAPGVFIDNGYSATATFTHDLAQRVPLSLSYRFEVTHVDAGDTYFCVDYGVCDAATRAALRTRSTLSPLVATASIDRRNDPENPTAGYIVRGEFQYASQLTASDYHYERGYVNASLYRPIGRTVLAMNARAGQVAPLGRGAAGDTIGGVLHPTVRFYAGGSESVRGFGENELGPQVLTVAPNVLRGSGKCPLSTPIQTCPVNGVPYLTDADFTPQAIGGNTLLEGSIEWRFPIHQPFGGVAFLDAGTLRGQGNLPDVSTWFGAVTPGFGVRYYSAIGPIRVDIGLNPLTTYHLVVLTQTSANSIVVVTGPPGTSVAAAQRVYAPARTLGGLQGLLYRFSLHVALGQAF